MPGYEQSLDFFIQYEYSSAIIVEAKITEDGGTARDKVARIERLVRIWDESRLHGKSDFQVVACIDGSGFGVRRQGRG